MTWCQLGGGDKAVLVHIVKESFGHTFLHQLAQALNQGDGPVVLGEGVVCVVLLRYHHDQRMSPLLGVVAVCDAHVSNCGRVIFDLIPKPLKDPPGDACGAWSGV